MDKEFLQGLAAQMPESVIEAILEKAGQEDKLWQEKYDQAVAAHARQREEMILEQGITALGGRNQKPSPHFWTPGRFLLRRTPRWRCRRRCRP